jgi:hypothetical protein
MNLTDARRRALEAVAGPAGRAYIGAARISNSTDVRRGYVYWQTARWLSEQGWVEPGEPDQSLVLTDAGHQACRDLNITVAGDDPLPAPPHQAPPVPAAARHRGHTLEWDPPHPLSNVMRWTCTGPLCGAAVLSYQGNVYGTATTTYCPCPAGCGCIGPDDADATECACDGPCTMSDTWVDDRTPPTDLRGDDGPYSDAADSRMRRP